MTSAPTSKDIRTMRTIAQAARLAPSVHNTQPWHFEIGPGSFDLHVDRSRQLHSLDPTGRQLMISVGCALLNARVSAAAHGLHVDVDRLPLGDAHNPIARLRPTPGGLSADEAKLSVLEPLLQVRSTNRRRFADEPVPEDLIEALMLAADAEGARMTHVRDENDRLAIARLSQRADAMQYQDGAYRAEIRAWTSDDPNRLDGVPARAVPHFDAGSGDEIPIRDFDSTGAGWLPTDTRSSHNQCLLLLGTDGDHPEQWLRAGEALERVWLEIARHGFVMSPLTQIVEVASIRAALRQELRMSMYPHILMRVGRAAPTAGVPRRHLEELLADPPAHP
jgi:nitroreductase